MQELSVSGIVYRSRRRTPVQVLVNSIRFNVILIRFPAQMTCGMHKVFKALPKWVTCFNGVRHYICYRFVEIVKQLTVTHPSRNVLQMCVLWRSDVILGRNSDLHTAQCLSLLRDLRHDLSVCLGQVFSRQITPRHMCTSISSSTSV